MHRIARKGVAHFQYTSRKIVYGKDSPDTCITKASPSAKPISLSEKKEYLILNFKGELRKISL
jgi:hypothetical protein